MTQSGERLGSDRAFGFDFAAVFALLGVYPLLAGGTLRYWALGIAGVFAASALIRPAVLHPLNRLWFRFGTLLYRVLNPVVMAILYVIVILPVGIAFRLSGKDPLRLKRDPAAAHYWIVREPRGPAPESMRDQF